MAPHFQRNKYGGCWLMAWQSMCYSLDPGVVTFNSFFVYIQFVSSTIGWRLDDSHSNLNKLNSKQELRM